MQLFIYEPAYRRLQSQIHAICPQMRPILIYRDCRVEQDGRELPPGEFHPDAAWISTDLFFQPRRAGFFRLLLGGPRLKWLQSAAAGFDNPIFQDLAKKTDIYTNSNGAAKSIAEFIFANVIEYFQPFAKRRDAQRAHDWRRFQFRDIAGTEWMIIGYGNIGQQTGLRARAFEARVTGVRRHPTGSEPADAMLRPEEMLSALPNMDVVVLTADSNDSTRHLVNADFLAAMKPQSVLVNIARGALIDEAALLESLSRGRPGYAILDVFETEPLPKESPFWDHPNVRVTAHCAAASPMMEPRGDAVFLRNLAHYAANEPLELQVRF